VFFVFLVELVLFRLEVAEREHFFLCGWLFTDLILRSA
jgi:hypothetical protein